MRTKMLLALPALAFVALTAYAASPAAAGPAPGKEQKVRKLMELTNAEAAARQVMDAVMVEFENNPQLPKGFAQKFKENAAKDDLVSLYVPIYVKHMDEKDLDEAIKFWSSPAGRRISKAQPLILDESMQAGQKWGQRVAEKTMQEMQPR